MAADKLAATIAAANFTLFGAFSGTARLNSAQARRQQWMHGSIFIAPLSYSDPETCRQPCREQTAMAPLVSFVDRLEAEQRDPWGS